MSIFNVELKKVVDDTYDIEIGYNLSDTLVSDLENGLVGKIQIQMCVILMLFQSVRR